jgi:hypothetical protein
MLSVCLRRDADCTELQHGSAISPQGNRSRRSLAVVGYLGASRIRCVMAARGASAILWCIGTGCKYAFHISLVPAAQRLHAWSPMFWQGAVASASALSQGCSTERRLSALGLCIALELVLGGHHSFEVCFGKYESWGSKSLKQQRGPGLAARLPEGLLVAVWEGHPGES